ncbi:MAG: ABC transporter ATP-binding protein [Spirochaetaceae bacterium]|jgi:branched-chain amino acid transport system ATP-binding protein|nr:ABC transporter ATP-binding protein [Spirochaetaceae bacterium]
MLEVRDLHAEYGGIKALRGVSLRVEAGEIVAVLGANGAGKSTLLNCISRVENASAGRISFMGKELPRRPHQVVRSGLVQVPEGRRIFTHLTVRENLMTGAYCRRDRRGIREDLERVYALFPRLKERAGQYGGHLSGGEQQMLAISRGIMARPSLMMLDEPSLGLAPIMVDQIFEILKEINRAGATILLVEQNARKALTLCSRAYIMSTGTMERSGTGAELLVDEALIRSYLGGGES